jgi:hypothetical protein
LGKIGNVDEHGDYQSMLKTTDDTFDLQMSAIYGGRGIITFIAIA